jgi:hypothetical protein
MKTDKKGGRKKRPLFFAMTGVVANLSGRIYIYDASVLMASLSMSNKGNLPRGGRRPEQNLDNVEISQEKKNIFE